MFLVDPDLSPEQVQAQREYLFNTNTAFVVTYIMRDQKLSEPEAFQLFYSSPTFALLQNWDTLLYRESPAYIYEHYQKTSGVSED
jgi:hypothetical protein